MGQFGSPSRQTSKKAKRKKKAKEKGKKRGQGAWASRLGRQPTRPGDALTCTAAGSRSMGHARGHPAGPAGSGQARPLAGQLGRPSQPGRPPSRQVIKGLAPNNSIEIERRPARATGVSHRIDMRSIFFLNVHSTKEARSAANKKAYDGRG
jgi:hypothetical protein